MARTWRGVNDDVVPSGAAGIELSRSGTGNRRRVEERTRTSKFNEAPGEKRAATLATKRIESGDRE